MKTNEPLSPAAIRDQIDRIMRSQSFSSKNQIKRLLEVLVNNMASQTSLKPDGVIKELWPEETQTKKPADVAKEMSRLRRTLEDYYDEEGKSDPITISLPIRTKPGPDGKPERRRIIAEIRGAEDQAVPPRSGRSKRLKMIMIAAAALGLCLAGYIFLRYPAVTRPYSARLDGTTFAVMDAEGRELWRKSFPDGFWPEYYELGLASRVRFWDLDGDGHTSVLFLYHSAIDPISHSTTLICYSDHGQEKWRWMPGRVLPELAGSPATFRTVDLEILRPMQGTHARIVVSSWHLPFYPHQLAILDSNGKMMSEYWHSGHLDHITLTDLNADGHQQIIATGISNGYRQATLVVLESDRVFGASVESARPEIQIHGFGFAKERFRLLFHRSDLNTVLGSYNEGQAPTVDHGRIRLAVLECRQRPGCLIWYEFDRNFHLLSAQADDYFRSAHTEFYRNDKHPHSFSAAEEKEFQKVRCLFGCESEFVPIDIH